MQESQTAKKEMRQQQRMKVMKDMTKNFRSKGRMDSELLAADCETAWMGRHCVAMV